MNRTIAFLVFVSALAPAPRAFAVGESVDGFPSYAERVQHELTNRARVDPQFEMTACGANCGEAACYTPQPPLRYKAALNRSARFHAAHLNKNGYFAFNSSCQLVSNIADIFPSQCDGSASCSCVGGVQSCPCTAFDQRIGLFGSSASGSLLASAAGPEQAFYLMLFAPSASSTCSFSVENSSRFQLLTSSGGIGFGAEGGDFVGDLVRRRRVRDRVGLALAAAGGEPRGLGELLRRRGAEHVADQCGRRLHADVAVARHTGERRVSSNTFLSW